MIWYHCTGQPAVAQKCTNWRQLESLVTWRLPTWMEHFPSIKIKLDERDFATPRLQVRCHQYQRPLQLHIDVMSRKNLQMSSRIVSYENPGRVENGYVPNISNMGYWCGLYGFTVEITNENSPRWSYPFNCSNVSFLPRPGKTCSTSWLFWRSQAIPTRVSMQRIGDEKNVLFTTKTNNPTFAFRISE